MKKSIAKNYIYNVIYQVFALITPLITTPYIARVLSAEGVGQYSFSSSLSNYFVLFAALGFGYYAQRAIADVQDDKKAQTLIFYEILIVRFVSVFIALAINLLLYFIGVYQSYSELMLYWSILIVATEFDITFLFQGNEEFGKIVIRNMIVKIISIAAIFIFVKQADQVWIYVLCIALSTLLGNISLWFYLPKYLTKCKLKELHPAKHIVPTLRLFVPTIAVSIYTVLDKTLIGLIITETTEIDGAIVKVADLENGYYEQSEKIVKMAITIISALGSVMIPRNTKLYADKNEEDLKKNIYFATNYVWFIGLPMMAGLIALAHNIIPWFLGEGYEKSIPLLMIFSPLIIIIGMSNVFGLQYLIPTKRDKNYTIAIVSGSLTNLVLNIVLIKFFYSYGAVIASLAAEMTVTMIMLLMIKKEISILEILKQCIKPLIASIIMFVAVYFTSINFIDTWYTSIIFIFEGIVTYILTMLLLRDKFLFSMIDLAKAKILKRNK